MPIVLRFHTKLSTVDPESSPVHSPDSASVGGCRGRNWAGDVETRTSMAGGLTLALKINK